MSKEILVNIDNEKHEGMRLDVFVSSFLQIPRNKSQKAINNGYVTVNDEQKEKKYILKRDDVVFIKIGFEEKEKEKFTISNEKLKEVRILYECDDYIIIYKPSGIPVHQDNNYDMSSTVIGEVLKSYPEIENIGDKNRPGIVHRLDMYVSGVMVIARNTEMFENLKNQFSDRKVDKQYKCLVYGVIKKDEGIIKNFISRKRDGFMAVTREGRESETHFCIIKRYRKYSFLDVYPKTGRTHQIRVHMYFYGHPVVGEKYYINRKKIKDDLDIDRLFLHSYKIGFNDLSGKRVEYSVDLDDQLANLLLKLKQ